MIPSAAVQSVVIALSVQLYALHNSVWAELSHQHLQSYVSDYPTRGFFRFTGSKLSLCVVRVIFNRKVIWFILSIQDVKKIQIRIKNWKSVAFKKSKLRCTRDAATESWEWICCHPRLTWGRASKASISSRCDGGLAVPQKKIKRRAQRDVEVITILRKVTKIPPGNWVKLGW